MIATTLMRLGVLGRAAAVLLVSAAVVCGTLLAGGLGPARTSAAYNDNAYMNLSMKVIDQRTVVITGRIEAPYGTTPTGTVILQRGAASLGTATLDGGAYRFELAVPMTWTGDVLVDVVYGGDANHEATRDTITLRLGG